MSKARWFSPVILAAGRLSPEDCFQAKASLGYSERPSQKVRRKKERKKARKNKAKSLHRLLH